jgi:three-Cys-motif partner protein
MEQRFGGVWTATKLQALQYYLVEYVKALKRQPFELHYIDAFAGSGKFTTGEGEEVQRGSALIALEISGFKHYHFFEKSKRRCRSLEAQIPAERRHQVEVCVGDANTQILELLGKLPRSARAAMFLDPYGMHVEWSTLQAIRKTQKVDVWYLFPLSGITRQLALKKSKVDQRKADALDRVLGTPDWRQAFYEEAPNLSLFGEEQSEERSADVSAIQAWLTARLKGEFPAVVGPKELRLSRKKSVSEEADLFGKPEIGSAPKGQSGPRLFALYCLISNPAAVKVASAIAKGVFDRLEREERDRS